MALKIPQAPLSANINDIHQSLSDLIDFTRKMFENGTKYEFLTQKQIDALTDPSVLGTIVFNRDTNEPNISYLDNGIVRWRAI